jgi:hypothetical protein
VVGRIGAGAARGSCSMSGAVERPAVHDLALCSSKTGCVRLSRRNAPVDCDEIQSVAVRGVGAACGRRFVKDAVGAGAFDREPVPARGRARTSANGTRSLVGRPVRSVAKASRPTCGLTASVVRGLTAPILGGAELPGVCAGGPRGRRIARSEPPGRSRRQLSTGSHRWSYRNREIRLPRASGMYAD